MATATEIYTYILLEADENELMRFSQAIRDRKYEINRMKGRSFKVGDSVVTTDGLSPKYMSDRHGTILKLNSTTAWVTFAEPLPGRFARATRIKVPLSCLRGDGETSFFQAPVQVEEPWTSTTI